MQDPAATAALAPNPEQQLRCPRCESSNTKFCYYNNYNLAQPRHFCKSCRRYWTHGGALRNVPVGGGSRKASKRSADPTTTSSAPDPKRPTVSPNTPLEILNPEPVSAVAPTADHQHPMVDISGGGFSSVLRPGGQFLDAVKNLATPSPAESFLELHGDASCWVGGWPYLSFYAPGSNLQ